MHSSSKSYAALPSELTPCLAEQVFLDFIHEIAIYHLIFNILGIFYTITSYFLRRILHSRYVRKRKWILSPRVWMLYLRIWMLRLGLWMCQSTHWARKKILQGKERMCKRSMYEVIELLTRWLVEPSRDMLKCPAVFIGMTVIEAVRRLIVDVATDFNEAVKKSFVYMAEFIKDAAEVLKELHDAGSITEDNQVWTVKKKGSVKRDMAKKELEKKEAEKETSRPSTAIKINSKVDRRTYASFAAAYLKTDLENDSNRNWSNEHGNLSPGSSPSRRLTQIWDSGVLYPSPFVEVSHSGPKSLPSSGSGSTIHTPTSTTSPSTGDMYTPNASDTTSASSSGGGQTPSVSSYSSGSVKTPSESSSSSGGIKTPSESSASSNPVDTPSASGSPSGGVRTPLSTSNTDSEYGSLPDYREEVHEMRGGVRKFGQDGIKSTLAEKKQHDNYEWESQNGLK